MAKTWKWSFWDAFSIFLNTYAEDWGGPDKVRRAMLTASDITEIPRDKKMTGLMSGTGQPVIFIHGSPGNALRWKNYFNHVPQGYQFISIDRMGFGKRYDEHPDLGKDCQQIAAFLQGFSAPILVGHSLGGALSLRLAATTPVKGLVLVAACLDPEIERALPVQKLGAHRPISWALSKSIYHSNLEMIHLQKFMQSTESHLKNLRSPVHIIHAKDDGLVPISHIDYARTHMKRVPLLNITTPETGGHAIAWNQLDLVLGAIKSIQS